MGRYIVKRILWLIPILLIISFVSFSLMYLSPGDPAEIYLSQGGQTPDPKALVEVRSQLGLDKPFAEQYFNWLGGLFRGDLGTSFFTQKPVMQEIATLFPNTLALTFLGMALTLVIAIPLGILCATHENKIIDYISSMERVSTANKRI